MLEQIRKDIDAICSIYPTIQMYDEPRERLAGRIAKTIAEVNASQSQRHPMQEIVAAESGSPYFRENAIVQALLQHGQNTGFGLNEIAMVEDFSQDDYEQFSQLHGYSLCGYHELSGVSDKSALRASEAAKVAGLPDTGCRSTGCDIHLGVETV